MWKPNVRPQNPHKWWHLAITVAVVAAVLAANLALMAFAADRNLFIDTTREGRYTVREDMFTFLREANMQDDVDIIFCADADILRADYNASLVYILALELELEVPNIHVSTVNVSRHPEAVEKYKRTAATVINWNDVIITSGTEYRVYGLNTFFTVDENTNAVVGFNGERRMCEAILSMTAKSLPIACFTVGNGETLPRQDDEETGYLYDRIRDAGFLVMAIDLEREDIPEDCTLLIINGPTEDFSSDRIEDIDYNSPITKIDRFLDRYGSVYYFRDPAAGTLPNLEEFLREWGISFAVQDHAGNTFQNVTLQDTGAALSGDPTCISGVYGSSSVYAEITALSSPPKTIFKDCAPVNVLWKDGYSSVNSAGRTVTALFTTTDKAYAVNAAGDTVAGGSFPLMTMTSETRIVNNDYFTATLFVCGTTAYHAAEYMADNVYANGEILQSTLRGAARTTVSVYDDLPFKFYESTDFTTSYEEEENTVYKRDEYGNAIWVVDPETGVSEHIVLRVLRPMEKWEASAWMWTLIGLPALVCFVCGSVVVLRRKNR